MSTGNFVSYPFQQVFDILSPIFVYKSEVSDNSSGVVDDVQALPLKNSKITNSDTACSICQTVLD